MSQSKFILIPHKNRPLLIKTKADQSNDDSELHIDGAIINLTDSEKPSSNQDVTDPTGPAARKGVLISFRTGKTMEIPEKDIVSCPNLFSNPIITLFVYLSSFPYYEAKF